MGRVLCQCILRKLQDIRVIDVSLKFPEYAEQLLNRETLLMLALLVGTVF